MQFSMEMLYRLKITNLLLVNVFFIGQFILLSLFFKSLFINKKQKNCVTYSMCLVLFLIICQYCYDYSLLFVFDLFEITVTSVLILIFALLHFYNMLSEQKTYYYITIAVIFFMFGSTILYLVGNLTLSLSDDVKYLTWTLNAFLFIIYQLVILYEWKVSFSKKRVLQV